MAPKLSFFFFFFSCVSSTCFLLLTCLGCLLQLLHGRTLSKLGLQVERSKSNISPVLLLCFLCFQMGNASENFPFVSTISKDIDIIMATLYTILGGLLHLFPATLQRFPVNVLTSVPLSPRGAVSAGEWNPSPCGL